MAIDCSLVIIIRIILLLHPTKTYICIGKYLNYKYLDLDRVDDIFVKYIATTAESVV